MSQIEINSYSKIIKGKTILDNINFVFESGKIYGLYGKNGSGKTMLLRAIAGLIYPTSGTVNIDKKELHKDISFPDSLGIIIENISLLPYLDAVANLKSLAKIKKICSIDDIRITLKKVGLDPDDKRKVSQYSLGMKQKLAIAQAIMENPKLLLLDEPTNALDEESIKSIRAIFKEMNNKGTTIIIASHNKEDLEVLTDYQLKIENGKLLIPNSQNS